MDTILDYIKNVFDEPVRFSIYLSAVAVCLVLFIASLILLIRKKRKNNGFKIFLCVIAWIALIAAVALITLALLYRYEVCDISGSSFKMASLSIPVLGTIILAMYEIEGLIYVGAAALISLIYIIVLSSKTLKKDKKQKAAAIAAQESDITVYEQEIKPYSAIKEENEENVHAEPKILIAQIDAEEESIGYSEEELKEVLKQIDEEFSVGIEEAADPLNESAPVFETETSQIQEIEEEPSKSEPQISIREIKAGEIEETVTAEIKEFESVEEVNEIEEITADTKEESPVIQETEVEPSAAQILQEEQILQEPVIITEKPAAKKPAARKTPAADSSKAKTTASKTPAKSGAKAPAKPAAKTVAKTPAKPVSKTPAKAPAKPAAKPVAKPAPIAKTIEKKPAVKKKPLAEPKRRVIVNSKGASAMFNEYLDSKTSQDKKKIEKTISTIKVK